MHLSHAEREEEKDANEFSYLNFYLQFIPASSDSCSDSAEWDEAADWAGVVAYAPLPWNAPTLNFCAMCTKLSLVTHSSPISTEKQGKAGHTFH